MAQVHALVRQLLGNEKPFLAVCLGHQVLCHQLGLELYAVDPPLQGVQQMVQVFERQEPVGFYNTFFACNAAMARAGVEISSEPDGRVIALRGPHYYGGQFHPESVLTTNGLGLLADALSWLLDAACKRRQQHVPAASRPGNTSKGGLHEWA